MKMSKTISLAILVSVLGIAAVIFLVFGNKKGLGENPAAMPNGQNNVQQEDLFQYKNQYIGDNSNDSNLVNSLSFPEGLKYAGLELYTSDTDVKTIRIIFNNIGDRNAEDFDVKRNFGYNSMIIFALIENCEQVTYAVNENGQSVELSSRQRPWAIEMANGDPYLITDTKENFAKFLEDMKKIDFANIKVYTTNLEQSISDAILTINEGIYYEGEFASQGHITMLTQEQDQYTIASVYAEYVQLQFQNGIFEVCAGSSMPYKLIFSKDAYGNYILSDHKTAQDGAMYLSSLYELFSEDVVNKIQLIPTDTDSRQTMENQIISHTKSYLDSINRTDSKISLIYQEKAYPPLSESNAMEFDILYKAYTDYPYYVGTIEKIEDGKRYIYETTYQKDSESDIFGFTKSIFESSEIIENVKVKLDGGVLSVLDGDLRKNYYDIKEQTQLDMQAELSQTSAPTSITEPNPAPLP